MSKYGIVVNDTTGLGSTSAQIGGAGTALWKMLMNGTHLVGPYNCVEYVVLPPDSSVGIHTHQRTEEIYYIISGSPVMSINGEERGCRAGDLITAPIGTRHGIRNAGPDDVEFFVVEVFPGAGPSGAVLHVNLEDRDAERRVPLSEVLSGGWKFVECLEIDAGRDVDLGSTEDSEILFILDGSAEISVHDSSFDAGRGFALASPPDHGRRIRATDEGQVHAIRLAVAA
ncbi:MAG TPA: cupin domain-containing protein [Allosphingosinicella sp.]|jgi:mannose-6-phosphate isomerase-like protein (cupin superfamily)